MEEPLPYLQDLFLVQPTHQSVPVDELIVQEFMESSAVIEGGSSFFWLLSYLKREPVYVSSSVREVLGYHQSFISSDSISNFLRLVPAEDRDGLRKVFSDIHAYYQQISPEEKGLYRFDFNYRIQRADYRSVSVLQQSMFLQTTPDGFPLLELSVLTDFSTYKSNSLIQLQIYKLQDGAYVQVEASQYDESLDKITDREKEVLTLIAQGLTDKEIADKIGISLHTVKTHRKNILTKTSSRNTAEAVTKYMAAAAAPANPA